jgi:transposase
LFTGRGVAALSEQELRFKKLERELEIARQERDILKKALACLGQSGFLSRAAPMRTLARTRMGPARFFAKEN